MLNKKNVLLILSVFFVVIILFFSFKIITNRYLSNKKTEENKDEISSEKRIDNQNLEENLSQDKPGEFFNEEDASEDAKEENEIKEDADLPEEKENFLEIKKSDCDNRCEKYRKDNEEFTYCQEFCGLKEISKKDSIDDCEEMEGLEEDYCLRDLAVNKKNYSICEKIEDAGILKMCQNRITEELVKISGTK